MKAILHIFLVAAFAGIIAQAQTATPPAPWPAECRKWINEDVPYIITDRERRALKQLKTRGECEAFIEQFWLRRDPTPGTPRNEFKEEHYHRIAFAKDHFGAPSGVEGWKTDRGRFYIIFGPPDEIDAHPGGGPDAPPREYWLYHHIPGVGRGIRIEFVDAEGTGAYPMIEDPEWPDDMWNGSFVADFVSTEPGPHATVRLRQDRTTRISVPMGEQRTQFSTSIRITASTGSVVETQEFECKQVKLPDWCVLMGPRWQVDLKPLDPGIYTLTLVVTDLSSRSVHTYTVPVTVK